MDERHDPLKRLFGRRLRVELAMWVRGRQDATFFLLEAQQEMALLGHAASATRSEVQNLVECGLLVETSAGHRKYYSVAESQWWPVFDALSDAVASQPSRERR